MVHQFEKLEVWNKAQDFAVKIFKATGNFPKHQQYIITSQLLRAALSISNNIAEGCGKPTKNDFIKYLYIAIGSGKECISMLYLCNRIKLISEQEISALIIECETILKMLYSLIKSNY